MEELHSSYQQQDYQEQNEEIKQDNQSVVALTPIREIKRNSYAYLEQEKTELKNLLKEKFKMPSNNGSLPKANYNQENLGTWIYPASKTFRTYQFRIVRTSLFSNTLVTLPTGLGKTFIASTAIYNYFRWFTDGLIFFLAPTKPLVTQQVDAFAQVISEVPLDQIIELTGSLNKEKRKRAYMRNRIFFMTPQTLQKDIENNLFEFTKIVLLVIDEAHRATGNYAYCRIIQMLETLDVGFRIIALSATPVSKIENLQTIVQSLRVASFEVRDEDDEEIKQYTHDKNILEIIIEKENHITEMENKIYKIMSLALAFLKQVKLVNHTMQPKYLNKMNVLSMQEQFKGNMQNYAPSMITCVFERISTILSLTHAKKLLLTHGIESFSDYMHNFFDVTKKDKKNVKFLKEVKETEEYKDLQAYIEESKSTMKHPKLKKLSEILHNFFIDPAHKESKAIVFSSYRESANEVKRYLDKKNPGIVKAEVFVGQNNGGLSQKFQAAMIRKFKDGRVNTLIATCVAEEGLDIGNVDLIISYDCLASPIRMIQRFGRTGRQGNGQVIILIAKGEEEMKLKLSKKNSKNIMFALKQQSKQAQQALEDKRKSSNKEDNDRTQTKLNFGQAPLMPALQNLQKEKEQSGLILYSFNPTMLPEDINPKPQYRKLAPRTEEELKLQEFLLKKKRRSKTVDGSQKKKEKKKGRGKKKGSPKSVADDEEFQVDGDDNLDLNALNCFDEEEKDDLIATKTVLAQVNEDDLDDIEIVIGDEEITELNNLIKDCIEESEKRSDDGVDGNGDDIDETMNKIESFIMREALNDTNQTLNQFKESFMKMRQSQEEMKSFESNNEQINSTKSDNLNDKIEPQDTNNILQNDLDNDDDIDVEELTEQFWNDIESFISVLSQNKNRESDLSKKRKSYQGMLDESQLNDQFSKSRKQLKLNN